MALQPFVASAPAQSNQALSDIDQIRENTLALRDFEANGTAPSSPVAGQAWWDSTNKKLYQRNQANDTWLFLWAEEGSGYGPAHYHTGGFDSSERNVKNHFDKNITAAVTVHGIKQGAGNGFDADLLDGQHGAYYLAATHATATSGTHGITGNFVGTTDAQTLENKTIQGGSISANITVAGAYVDGRDPSVDGAKLDTYPGGGAPASSTVTQAKMDWPNAGGISQGQLLLDEKVCTNGGNTWQKIDTAGNNYQALIYIPANANSLEYEVRIKSGSSSYSVSTRVSQTSGGGAAMQQSTNSTTYTQLAVQTEDVSAVSGWVLFYIESASSTASGTDDIYVNSIAYRII